MTISVIKIAELTEGEKKERAPNTSDDYSHAKFRC
jgi:hypothetical protein